MSSSSTRRVSIVLLVAAALAICFAACAAEEVTKPKPLYGVLSGGGHWGLSHIGFLQVLESQRALGRFDGFEGLAGTSIGSLYGSLYVAGYTTPEMAFYFVRPKNATTDRLNIPLVGQTMLQNYGIFNGGILEPTLDNLYAAKTGYPAITFEQLYNVSGIEFTVVVYDLNALQLVYLNKNTAPNMKVSIAVQLSCSVPLLYSSRVFEDHHYIDGGVRDVYPFGYFSSQGPYFRRRTIGSTFITNVDTEVIETVDDYASQLLMLMQENNLPRVRPGQAARSVYSVMPAGVRDTETELTQVQATAIFNAGIAATTAFFADPDCPFL